MMNNVLRFSLFTSTAEDKTTAETYNQKDTDKYLRRQSPILRKKYLCNIYQNYADETIKAEICQPKNICGIKQQGVQSRELLNYHQCYSNQNRFKHPRLTDVGNFASFFGIFKDSGFYLM
jgi:hypothetical protein